MSSGAGYGSGSFGKPAFSADPLANDYDFGEVAGSSGKSGYGRDPYGDVTDDINKDQIYDQDYLGDEPDIFGYDDDSTNDIDKD